MERKRVLNNKMICERIAPTRIFSEEKKGGAAPRGGSPLDKSNDYAGEYVDAGQ